MGEKYEKCRTRYLVLSDSLYRHLVHYRTGEILSDSLFQGSLAFHRTLPVLASMMFFIARAVGEGQSNQSANFPPPYDEGSILFSSSALGGHP
jgi:hypothetical protein